MEPNPQVSIIMAFKDTARYLPECLESIANQSYEHWELIAVDDHSTDESLRVVEEFRENDPRIRVFRSQGHRLIPALQTGYVHAGGILINRMDSDDRMPVDKLEILVKAWSEHGKGTVIAGGTKHFVEKGKVGEGFLRYENWLNRIAREGRHREEIYRECVIPSHSWIMHREDFDKIGAFNSPVYPEDYDLCFRIYQAGLGIVGVDKILHYWRDRSDRISRTWEEYRDNRYFTLKVKYFFGLDRDQSRPLVLWGAGRNGKDLARLLLSHEKNLIWVCDNPRKVGHQILGVTLSPFETITDHQKPQILIAVAAEREREKIVHHLRGWGKHPVMDYWFFL